MSEDASFTSYPSYGEKTPKKSHFVTIFFIILLVVILILVGLYFLGASKKGTFNPFASVKPTESPASNSQPAQQAPTATPIPLELEREDLSVIILNGSGVAGAAGDVSKILEDLGYTVESTGNASKFDYTGITIFIKEENKAYLEMLKKDLADEAADIETKFDEKIKADAEIIVGK